MRKVILVIWPSGLRTRINLLKSMGLIPANRTSIQLFTTFGVINFWVFLERQDLQLILYFLGL